MKTSLLRPVSAALALALALPFAAQAHKAWLVPSATVVSGNAPWVSIDGAISNNLYYPDHFPMRLESLVITAPDGSAVAAQNPHTGKYRSVFDVELAQTGTYRIASVNASLSARWDTAESLAAAEKAKAAGAPASGPGSPAAGGFLRNATAEDLKTKVPKDAKNLQITQGSGRIETFVTNGAPSTGALKPTGKGLELVPVTHPNDLFAGETANFRLLIDGEAASGVDVEIVPGATRYRDSQDEIIVKTDAEGGFSVTWPAPGMYWLEASLRDDKATAPATARRASYVATLEVLPQ